MSKKPMQTKDGVLVKDGDTIYLPAAMYKGLAYQVVANEWGEADSDLASADISSCYSTYELAVENSGKRPTP